MFVIVGIGALIVWQLRKRMPESGPSVLKEIESEVERSSGRKLERINTPARIRATSTDDKLGELFSSAMIRRTITGSVILITLNTVIYGFIAFLPSFMVRQGLT
jgi:putative MFS transporter